MQLRFGLALTLLAVAVDARPRRASHRVVDRTSSAVNVDSAFELAEDFDFTAPPQLPICTGDPTCVFICKVKPDGSSGACYDNTGAEMTGYTEGVGALFAESYIKGTYSWLGLDDTSSSAAVPRISNAAIRSMFAGDFTLVWLGYPTTETNINGGWFGMTTDGTNGIQARRNSGTLQCLDGLNGNHSDAQLALNGFEMFSCTRTGGQLLARAQSVSGTAVASTFGAITGSNALYLWGGTGGCCTTGGTAAGQLVTVVGYSEGKAAEWHLAAEKAAFGASMIASGPLGSAGTVGASPIGRDDVEDGGVINVFVQGAYITDPVKGVHAQFALQNFWAFDPLDTCSDTSVGTPGCSANAGSGPLARWKNKAEADELVDDDAAAFEGKRSSLCVTGGNVYNGWYNLSAYLAAGQSGTTRTKARLKLVHNGTVDAGSDTCDVSGLGAAYRRQPLSVGCWAWIDNATSVCGDVLVGNATSDTGSVRVSQKQLTKSLFPESPTVDGLAKGATWPHFNASNVPYGATKGKLEGIFQIPYSTTQFNASNVVAQSIGSYVFDAFSDTASHDVLVWISEEGGQPSIDGLMYGQSGTTENTFHIAPVTVLARTFYVVSYEWHTSGGACYGRMRFDACPNPATCTATTIIADNTTVAGECPLPSDVMVSGTRGAPAGSSPSTIDLRELRIYR